jgi:uncharacterized protein with ParB-like and HNH nuclease domain
MKELQTLHSIFNHRVFRIPDYQRGYAWKEKQLIDFWEDLINLDAERYHYTGVLSIKTFSADIAKQWEDAKWLIEDRGYAPCHIVDGQQRLTTISIFIQCLIETCRAINPTKSDHELFIGSYPISEILSQYLVEIQGPNKLIKTYKFGYEVDNPSYEFLIHRIFNNDTSNRLEETYYTLNLEHAKAFFLENLKTQVEEEGADILSELFKKLTQRLMFNLYEISDDFDVFVAFETMNNRGKKLSDLELLKNRLIYLTTLYPSNEVSEEERKVVRNSVNQTWKEIYYQLGRNKKNPLNDDDFLRTHWIMYFKYSRKRGDDYIRYLLDEEFNPKVVLKKVAVQAAGIELIKELRDSETELEEDDDLEDTPTFTSSLSLTDIKAYVDSLREVVGHWYNTFNPDTDKFSAAEKLWMDRLNRIGIGYFRPLVSSLFSAKHITTAERVKVLQEIERFIFIAFRICRAQSNYGNSKYYNLARGIYRNELPVDSILSALEENSQWTRNENGTLKTTSFLDYLDRKFNSDGAGYYGWNGLRYFLYEYEEELMQSRNQPKVSWQLFIRSEHDRISIEHIYPQTATATCWETHFGTLTEGLKKRYNGSLGNLLPLSSSINSSLQNDCFEGKKHVIYNGEGQVKRNGYMNGSYSEQEVAQLKDWTPDQIKQRGLKLLEFMEKRWAIKLGDEAAKVELLGIRGQ